MVKVLLGMLVMGAVAMAAKLSPVYLAAYESADTIKGKLQNGGYEVVATYSALPQSTTIVFTDDNLKKEASKRHRAYIAVMKVFVDDKTKKVSVSNPLYFGKAFMQGDYDDAVFKKEDGKIKAALGNLTPAKDGLEFNDLEDYHFMMGMPYYGDQITVGEGSNGALLEKLKSYNGGKNVLFTLELGNATLVGFDLDDKIEAFPDKIGRQNAVLLPYTIKIEGNEATILHPKYYIAISYPALSMSDFMKISSVPGEIEDAIKAVFK